MTSLRLSSSIYGTVAFDLTFFNEVTKSDNILKSIEANVIDSCIEVIIGLPDIRSHRIVHRIPSYFDILTWYHHKVTRKRVPHRLLTC